MNDVISKWSKLIVTIMPIDDSTYTVGKSFSSNEILDQMLDLSDCLEDYPEIIYKSCFFKALNLKCNKDVKQNYAESVVGHDHIGICEICNKETYVVYPKNHGMPSFEDPEFKKYNLSKKIKNHC